jgi:drug/metabolite transporter (DMT)-like permease
MRESLKGQAAVIGCAVLWSGAGLLIKLVDWNPVVIAGARSFIAALFLMAVRPLRKKRSRVKSPRLPFWGAALGYAACMVSFVVANKLVGPAPAILLQYTSPVWAAFLGWALAKEKPFIEHWLVLIPVAAGLLLFFNQGLRGGSAWGIAIALFSGVTYGLHAVFLRMLKGGDPADALLASHVITAAVCLPFAFLYPPHFTLVSSLSLLAMGVGEIGCASLLFSYGILRVRAVTAMLTAIAEPVLNPCWVFLFTGDAPSLLTIIGGAIIIVSVVSSSLVSYRRER